MAGEHSSTHRRGSKQEGLHGNLKGCCAHISECKRKISDENTDKNLIGTVLGVGDSVQKLLEVQLLRGQKLEGQKAQLLKRNAVFCRASKQDLLLHFSIQQ